MFEKALSSVQIGDLIYPNDLKADLAVDTLTIYKMLEELKKYGYLSTVYEVCCHNCGNSKGVILLDSLLDLPDDIHCASCGQRLNIADDIIVIYRVVKRLQLLGKDKCVQWT